LMTSCNDYRTSLAGPAVVNASVDRATQL
jgi:hypothetical protein